LCERSAQTALLSDACKAAVNAPRDKNRQQNGGQQNDGDQ
jgi:hypothetical protein